MIAGPLVIWRPSVKIPEKFKGKELYTLEDFIELSQQFDIAIMHTRPERLTQKQILSGATTQIATFVAIDELGGRFQTRG